MLGCGSLHNKFDHPIVDPRLFLCSLVYLSVTLRPPSLNDKTVWNGHFGWSQKCVTKPKKPLIIFMSVWHYWRTPWIFIMFWWHCKIKTLDISYVWLIQPEETLAFSYFLVIKQEETLNITCVLGVKIEESLAIILVLVTQPEKPWILIMSRKNLGLK